MSFTLLHTADLHLGKSFHTLPPERAEQRRADVLATLTRLCRCARERRVDLLCIAGDLFDRAAPAVSLLAAVRAALAQAEVPVLCIPGNHDPLETGSPYLETHWPSNVHLARQRGWQRIALPGVELFAFGYTRDDAHRSAWAAFPGCGAEALLALHAACLTPGLTDDAGYYAFPPAAIPACGYLALGHHHRAAQLASAAWYAGSPEPLEPTVDPACALLVTLDGHGAMVEQLAAATRQHRLVTLDVTGLTAEEVWDRALAETHGEDLLHLALCGVLEAEESLDLPALQAELTSRSFYATLDADRLCLPAAARGEGVFGAVQEVAQARLHALPAADPQRRRLERAARYAALALEGKL